MVTAYLQFLYLGQDGFLGWDDDIRMRLGAVWHFAPEWNLSGQWIHDFTTYASNIGGIHQDDDVFFVQIRWTF